MKNATESGSVKNRQTVPAILIKVQMFGGVNIFLIRFLSVSILYVYLLFFVFNKNIHQNIYADKQRDRSSENSVHAAFGDFISEEIYAAIY